MGQFLEDFEKPKVVTEVAIIEDVVAEFEPVSDLFDEGGPAVDEVIIDEDASLPDVEALAKLSRPELEKMAKKAHLDGDKYTNRTELAKAIVAARK